jgi:hypothetical protein
VFVVSAHAASAVLHGAAHAGAGISLSPLGNALVAVLVFLGPLAAWWMMRAKLRAGSALLAASMAGALLFGLANHFLIAGADHVHHVPPSPWRGPFHVTAVLLLVTEAAGVVLGVSGMLQSGRAARTGE